MNLIYKIPDQAISLISESFFANLGFFRWQYHSTKIAMLLVYSLGFYLVWLCYREKENGRELRQFFGIYALTVIGITLLLLLSRTTDLWRSTAYFYYNSFIVIGLPICLSLMAHTLRKNRVLYHLAIFVIGATAIVNSEGFTKMGDMASKLGFGYSSATIFVDLKNIRHTIESGQSFTLDQKFKNLRQVDDWKTFPPWGEGIVPLLEAKYSFPVLYYYLIPYIQEGKVLIRKEYKKFFKLN